MCIFGGLLGGQYESVSFKGYYIEKLACWEGEGWSRFVFLGSVWLVEWVGGRLIRVCEFQRVLHCKIGMLGWGRMV